MYGSPISDIDYLSLFRLSRLGPLVLLLKTIVLAYGAWKAYHYKAHCRHVTYRLSHDVFDDCVLSYYILR